VNWLIENRSMYSEAEARDMMMKIVDAELQAYRRAIV